MLIFINEWKAASLREIRELEKYNSWVEILLSDVPPGVKVLPTTWTLSRKRTPDGHIKKVKGRFCVRGDLQEGNFETFVPVVAFSTLRLFLVMALLLGCHSCSADFSNAFVQAMLQEPIYIHLHRGFHSSRSGKTCLKLLKSFYGLSIAPRFWHEHLVKALLAYGFIQSTLDPYLFLMPHMFLILYCDVLLRRRRKLSII